ncbi:MAG TPA: 50S ribosomal protein L13 [Patescibacteria group bacterium]|nr:50S ribosomal protein L13 [Patescibacteria group bacterium]
MRKTFAPNPKKIDKKWHFIDAGDKILGKLASEIAVLLMGKNKAVYSPNEELGDKVVVTNVEKIAITGNKLTNKVYQRYTGYPGGLRTETLKSLKERRPTEVLRKAVKGMLPKNKLLKERMSNLYIYKGSEHPHRGQQNA